LKKNASPSSASAFVLSPPAQLLGVTGTLPSMMQAVLRPRDMELVPCTMKLEGVNGSLKDDAMGASKTGCSHSKSDTDFRERVLAPPLAPAIGVTSAKNGD